MSKFGKNYGKATLQETVDYLREQGYHALADILERKKL